VTKTGGITGAIVAGGASSRFGGQAKGLLRVGGQRIIDRIASALRPVVETMAIVSRFSLAIACSVST